VVHALCEDLLTTQLSQWCDGTRLDQPTLSALLAEVNDPVLRRHVVRLCKSVMEADGHLASGESAVLLAAMMAWGLEAEILLGLQDGNRPGLALN
jgi:hypothetical protein